MPLAALILLGLCAALFGVALVMAVAWLHRKDEQMEQLFSEFEVDKELTQLYAEFQREVPEGKRER